MVKVQRSITINAPVEQVFAYIEDPMNITEWLPSMMEVKDVAGSGVGQHYRWTYKMAGVRLEGDTTVKENIPNELRVVETKKGVVSTWSYTFEPREGGTKLNLDIEYTIPIPVLGKLADKLILRRNEREVDVVLANIKDKMEG